MVATLCPLHQTVDDREIRRRSQFRELSEALFLFGFALGRGAHEDGGLTLGHRVRCTLAL